MNVKSLLFVQKEWTEHRPLRNTPDNVMTGILPTVSSFFKSVLTHSGAAPLISVNLCEHTYECCQRLLNLSRRLMGGRKAGCASIH